MLAIRANASAVASMTSRIGKALAPLNLLAAAGVISWTKLHSIAILVPPEKKRYHERSTLRIGKADRLSVAPGWRSHSAMMECSPGGRGNRMRPVGSLG